jgi:uncharacterized protein (TIGR02001 family)
MVKKLLVASAALLSFLIASPGYAEQKNESALSSGGAGGAGGAESELRFVEDADSPFTSDVALVNNYLYRGISQSAGRPAMQAGFGLEDTSGFYAGVFGSSISWLNDLYSVSAGTAGARGSSVELDTYLGFKKKLANDLFYDVGFLRYNFPGAYAPGATNAGTNEIYGEVKYEIISAKYSYSLGNAFGNANTAGTDYFEVNANVPLNIEGLTLGAHVGRQNFKGTGAVDVAGNRLSYTDYKLGLAKEVNDFVLGIGYSRTNASAAYAPLGTNLGRGAVLLSIARSF